MSDSVQPQRWQPTRLPRPQDSPGKNTGVGCHFLLQCMKWKVKLLSRVRLLPTPWTSAYQAPSSMGFSRQEYWSGMPPPSPQITTNVWLKCLTVILRSRCELSRHLKEAESKLDTNCSLWPFNCCSGKLLCCRISPIYRLLRNIILL